MKRQSQTGDLRSFFPKSEPLKRKVKLIFIRCQDLIQSCPFVDKQSTEFQSSDCENDLVSSVCTVEPEMSSLPEVGSLAGSIDDHGPYDIGDPSKSMGDIITSNIITSVKKLSNGTKYSLLYNHVKPPRVCPSNLSHGVTENSIHLVEKNPWLLYSPKLDGVFCGPCSLLSYTLIVSRRIMFFS